MAACIRDGLTAPRIVQETAIETMRLSLVQCRVGVAFVTSDSRWRCPPGVVILPVTDLKLVFLFALMWRKVNNSPLLAKFAAGVRSMVQRKGERSKILS